ncbi:MAG: LicD family protein [Lachnospiraceae bacterium]|nr:LicD family protein [Lachnospiraceae bacterium]
MMRNIKEIQNKALELLRAFDRICSANNIAYTLAFGSVLGAVRHNGFIPWDTDVDVVICIDDALKLRRALDTELPTNMRLYKWDEEKCYSQGFDRIAFKNISHDEVHIDIFCLGGAPNDEKNYKKFSKKCYYTYMILHCKYRNLLYSRKRNRIAIICIKTCLFFVSDKYIKKKYKQLGTKYPYSTSIRTYIMCTKNRLNEPSNKEMIKETIRVPFEGLNLPIPKKFDEYLTKLYGDYMTPVRY